MSRLVLSTRLIVEAARRGRLSLSPAGVEFDGQPVDDHSGQEVVDLVEAGYLVEDGDLLVPGPLARVEALTPDEFAAKYRLHLTV